MEFKSLTPNMMVPDVDAAIAFYERALGFEKVMSMPEEGPSVFAILHAGAVELMLQSQESLREDIPAVGSRSIASSAVFYIEVEGLAELHERVRPHAEVVQGLRSTPYGMNEFYITDPNGYVLGFAERAPE